MRILLIPILVAASSLTACRSATAPACVRWQDSSFVRIGHLDPVTKDTVWDTPGTWTPTYHKSYACDGQS